VNRSSIFATAAALFSIGMSVPLHAAATFSVPALNPAGVNTGISVKQGDVVQFSAVGTWCWEALPLVRIARTRMERLAGLSRLRWRIP
jgi:hypothetical protein